MSPTSVFRAGATALITGGASGVGLAVAKLCAGHGMNLVLVDNNTDKLARAKSDLSSTSPKSIVATHSFDVSVESAWHTLRDSLTASSTTLDLLHLNAGIGPNSSFSSVSAFHTIFDTNFFGVLNGITTFLPQLSSSSPTAPKAIILTGSKQGITNPPGNPAYNASKAALKSVAEQLSFDLAKSAPATSVHLLVPGWTFTGLTSGGKMTTKPDGAWAPEQVAEYLYQKMAERRFYIICPDNDVTEDTDKRRMMWSVGDTIFGRQPLSRWREEYKDEAAKTMEKYEV